jgi:uncharacterized membrane protein YedE/YeeE
MFGTGNPTGNVPLKLESFVMLGILAQQTWSPYAAGAGIGVLVCLSFLLSDRPLGVSTAYAKVSGLLEKAISRKTAENEFYQETVPRVDWVLMILPGVIIGAFLSAILSGQFHLSCVPGLWETAFGTNAALRILTAFIGGVILAFGARWANGCTTGHSISGTSQLSLSGILFTVCFFLSGIAAAFMLSRFIGV